LRELTAEVKKQRGWFAQELAKVESEDLVAEPVLQVPQPTD
jgi:hypothetical protein